MQILFRLVPTKLKQDDPNPPTKYARDHPIFQKIWILITEGIWREEDSHWMPMAKEALDLVFQLGDGPDSLAGDMIKDVCSKIQEQGWNRILVPHISLQGQLLSLYSLPEVKIPFNPCQSLWQKPKILAKMLFCNILSSEGVN